MIKHLLLKDKIKVKVEDHKKYRKVILEVEEFIIIKNKRMKFNLKNHLLNEYRHKNNHKNHTKMILLNKAEILKSKAYFSNKTNLITISNHKIKPDNKNLPRYFINY